MLNDMTLSAVADQCLQGKRRDLQLNAPRAGGAKTDESNANQTSAGGTHSDEPKDSQRNAAGTQTQKQHDYHNNAGALKQISRRTAETMQEAPKQMSPTTAKRAPEHRVRTWRPYPCSSRPSSKQAPPPPCTPQASALLIAIVCSRWRHTISKLAETRALDALKRSRLLSLAPHDQ